jgi:hypothetical protein
MKVFAARYVAILAAGLTASTLAAAQVPAAIESELVHIGKIVDPACTAKLYRPLMPANDVTSSAKPLYPGVTVERDLSFGTDPKDVIDIFVADKGGKSRDVLIYVPGGGGNKIELQSQEAHAFYDNIGRWAANNGMVGVNMQRHFSPGWSDGAKDIAAMLRFVQANIAKYHGNPERIFIWAHSAGNMPLGTYMGRPELWGPKGVGVKGVIFMSAAPFNILPLKAEMGSPDDMMKMFALAGKTCGAPGPMSSDAPLPGKAVGQPGGPNAPMAAPVGPRPAVSDVDAAMQLTRSSLPALKNSSAKILLANAELDIGTDPAQGNVMAFNRVLRDELCKEGTDHCPTLLIAKGHSHMSIVFSIDTPDTTVSSPILAWIRATK